MFNVVTLPVVGLLSASCRPIVPPSSNAASFVLIFLLTFLTFFLRLPFLTVFSFPLSVCPIHFFCLDFIVRMRDLSSSIVSNRAYILICVVFCPADFLRSSQSPRFNSLKSFYIRCPRFWTIQHHTAYQCLYHPYLQCSVRPTFPLISSLVFENASFDIAILHLISRWQLKSVIIILIKWQNSFTFQFLFLHC